MHIASAYASVAGSAGSGAEGRARMPMPGVIENKHGKSFSTWKPVFRATYSTTGAER